uniref:Uncharacterized protein n=1 Tax=Romanomermis culicivorax TaxID=13658 RepID=A0A915JJ64_ROMCU
MDTLRINKNVQCHYIITLNRASNELHIIITDYLLLVLNIGYPGVLGLIKTSKVLYSEYNEGDLKFVNFEDQLVTPLFWQW